MWVATASAAEDAAEVVDDVKPDAVIVDADCWPPDETVQLVRSLAERPPMQDHPIVVLTGNAAACARVNGLRNSDCVLTKPLDGDALIRRVRERLDGTRRKTPAPAAPRVAPPAAPRVAPPVVTRKLAAATDRPCPTCGGPLEWLERGRIDGNEYDYYRWCLNSCGLYCYDLRAEKWVKLV